MKHLSTVLLLAVFLTQTVSAEDSLDSTFATSKQLTDEQIKQSKEFSHQGRSDRKLKESCEAATDSKNCNQNADEVGAVLGGTFGQMLENNIGKLYGLLFGASSFLQGGGGPSVNVINKAKKGETQLKAKDLSKDQKKMLNKEGTLDAEGKGSADSQSDYCLYAAIGYEMVGGFWQQAMQDKIEKNLAGQTDTQVKSLMALEETHKARRKTALFQGTLYGATSACYITRAIASKGRVVMDAKYWAKMGGAAALSTLYLVKAKKHKLAAKAVENVRKALPHPGECNPWTQTACFCGETSSKTLYPMEYEEACVAKGKDTEERVAMGCGVLINGKMSYDKECKCKQNNNCFKAKLSQSKMKFGFGTNMMNEANKAFELLGSGEFDVAKFNAAQLQMGANASKVRSKIAPIPAIGIPKLNDDEKKIADSLKDIAPPAVAALAAKSEPRFPDGSASSASEGVNNALAGLPKDLKDKVEAFNDPAFRKSGSGFGEEAAADDGFAMPSIGGVTEAQPDSTEVLSFAEAAVNNADVTKTQDKPLFEIISDRYKRASTRLND